MQCEKKPVMNIANKASESLAGHFNSALLVSLHCVRSVNNKNNNNNSSTQYNGPTLNKSSNNYNNDNNNSHITSGFIATFVNKGVCKVIVRHSSIYLVWKSFEMSKNILAEKFQMIA